MEVGDGARGVFLGQALRAVTRAKTQVTGPVHGGDEFTPAPEIVEGFPAQEPLGVLVKQLGEGRAADMANEVIQGLGDRERILRGARQAVEIMEDGAFEVAQVVIGGTSAAQAQPKQEQAPPTEKAAMILDPGFEAGVGQLVQPLRQGREEVADGGEKDADQSYDLPCGCRRARTGVRIRAKVSWVMGWTSCLRRRCS